MLTRIVIFSILLCAPALADGTLTVNPALVQDTVAALNKAMLAQCGDMDRINREWIDLLKQGQQKPAAQNPPTGDTNGH